MKTKDIINIVSKVYPKIIKDYTEITEYKINKNNKITVKNNKLCMKH